MCWWTAGPDAGRRRAVSACRAPAAAIVGRAAAASCAGRGPGAASANSGSWRAATPVRVKSFGRETRGLGGRRKRRKRCATIL